MNTKSQRHARTSGRDSALPPEQSQESPAGQSPVLERVPLDFIVLGLPRSATTWVANWLTTDRSLCLHDPFAHGLPEAWPKDGRLRGISCTTAALMHRWISGYTCPIAIIERDPALCDQSLRRLGLAAQLGLPSAAEDALNTSTLLPFLDVTPGRRIAFDDLWDEDAASELWGFLLPSLPFDGIRYRLLRSMQVQPMRHDELDFDVMRRLIDAGLYQGKL